MAAVAIGPVREPHWALREVARSAADAGAPLLALAAGRRLQWPGLTLDVLGPQHPDPWIDPDDGSAVNDGSLVLRASTGIGTALLTGDVELAAQADLLASGVDLRADVLKMPHHGSRYTSVGIPQRRRAARRAGQRGGGNRYRHPDPGLLGGLERAGIAVRRTDTGGDVAVVAASGGSRGSADGGRARCRAAPRRTPNSSPGAIRFPPVAGGRRSDPAALQRLADGPTGGGHGRRRTDLAGDGVERLEPVAGDQQHGLGVGVELSGSRRASPRWPP